MKKSFVFTVFFLIIFLFYSCKDESNSIKIKDVGLKVTFNSLRSASLTTDATPMTSETPENYFVALKSVKLLGDNGSPDILLFNKENLSESLVFDFTNNEVVHSLLNGTNIPEGEYSSIEIEIYYLQMNIAIATGERGIERRNFRIYLSDDAHTEGGLHQPGDMTQINSGVEIGWLLGEGQIPNLDPVTPRTAAYTASGNGDIWYNFGGKSGENYGPFGDVNFMNTAPHPIYRTRVNFTVNDNGGNTLLLDFNVNGCWKFQDKSRDGVFGVDDLDPNDPTAWQMDLPIMTVSIN